MAKTTYDWTHTLVIITDIRKLNKLYVIKILSEIGNNNEKITHSLFINEKIFDDRLKSYFLKEAADVTRNEILNVKWNMYITKGYYIKIIDGSIKETAQDPEKYYISFLDIAGELGTFHNIYKTTE
jgi:hypothetical protein